MCCVTKKCMLDVIAFFIAREPNKLLCMYLKIELWFI